MDNEIKGSGNSLEFEFRIFDSRIGRFLSTDPISKTYPMLTPYQYASDNPIMNVDIEGLEGTSSTGAPTVTQKEKNEMLKDTPKGTSNGWDWSNGNDGWTGQQHTWLCSDCGGFNSQTNEPIPMFFVTRPTLQVNTTKTESDITPTGAAVPGPGASNTATFSLSSGTTALLPADRASLTGALGGLVPGATTLDCTNSNTTPTETTRGKDANNMNTTVETSTTTNTGTQNTVVNVNIVVNLSTTRTLARGGSALLNTRFNVIRNFYISLGVPAASITRGTMSIGVTSASIGGNQNQTIVNVNGQTSNTPVQQTIQNTTVKQDAYRPVQ